MSERARTVEDPVEVREPADSRELRPVDGVVEAVPVIDEPAPRRDPGEGQAATGAGATAPDVGLFLPVERRDDLRRTWLEVQSSFIDEPKDAVRRADGLVQELLRSVAEGFEAARHDLEGEWQRGEDVNTESLRLALRRYRALFERLLAF